MNNKKLYETYLASKLKKKNNFSAFNLCTNRVI